MAGPEPGRNGTTNQGGVLGLVVDDKDRELDHVQQGGPSRSQSEFEVLERAIELRFEATVARKTFLGIDSDLARHENLTEVWVLDHDDLTKGLRPVGQPRWVEMSESHRRAMSALQVGSHAPWQVKVVARAA